VSELDGAGFVARLEAETTAPFDLANGPVFRAVLFRRSPTEAVLSLAMHHVAGDLWSFVLLFGELQKLVAGESDLGPRPAQYFEFVDWQANWLESASAERSLEYWQKHLSPLPPPLALPTDRPAPKVQGFRGDFVRFSVEPEASRRLRALARIEAT